MLKFSAQSEQCLPFTLRVSPLYPPTLSPSATVKLTSDWLRVVLEFRSFCYWNTCQTVKNREIRGLRSIHIVNMAGYKSAPLT